MSEFQFAPPLLNTDALAEQTETTKATRRFKKRWLALVIGVVMILSVPILLGYVYAREVYYPSVASGDMIEVVVEPGANVDVVIDQLMEKGLLDQPTIFKLYLRFSGSGANIQAGKFTIPQHISISDLSERLGVAMREQAVLRFTEGWRREEMAEYIDKQQQSGEIGFSGKEFSNIALNPTTAIRQKLGNRLPADATLHGFLFPDTYHLDRDATAEDLITEMVDTYLAKVTQRVQSGIVATGLSEYEAVILAAIVEREAYAGEERPVIAKILMKRLQAGEILGTDATVQYALGYSDAEKRWWKQGITMADLEIDSPYNTRRRAGLPPAPISNPGIEAIEAVAFPQNTPYMFYLHDSEGGIHYATTLAEHNANVAKYIR